MPKFIAQAYILYQDVLEYSRFEYLHGRLVFSSLHIILDLGFQ